MKKDNLTYSFLALRDKLHRIALRYLKNDEDAKDALQDTFFKLWKNGDTETDLEARNKLFAVLRNICIDKLRKPLMVSLNETDYHSLPASSDSYEDIQQLQTLITSGLTDIQMKIYSLVTEEGIEYDQIADSLKMSVEAVRMNMSRARKKIRDNYNKL